MEAKGEIERGRGGQRKKIWEEGKGVVVEWGMRVGLANILANLHKIHKDQPN